MRTGGAPFGMPPAVDRSAWREHGVHCTRRALPRPAGSRRSVLSIESDPFDTTYRSGRRLYPSQVLIHAPDGGLGVDSVAMGEQVRALAKSRLGRRRGVLAPQTMAQLDHALLIALDLPS
jgi:mRNA-degrading endonuclease toxin of MazEF toxin-antitoxin module